ncbi:MAG: heparinase II/III family protein [Terracidiphilus sp.]|nr:heparinase II/III family protein [Terracidiphilus sp.]
MNRREFVAASIALAGQQTLLRPLAAAAAAPNAPAVAGAPQNLLSTTFTQSFLESHLTAPGAWHPYATASERGPWEAVPADIRAAFVARAEAEQKEPWTAFRATRALDFKRNGNRTRFEADSFGRRARLLHLVLAECMEAKGRFLDEIVNGIWLVCEESFWGVPAHLGAQKAGVGLPDVNEPIIDLFAAATGQLLAWTHYLLAPQLETVSPLVNPRIALETERRILKPARERDDFGWMGLSPKSGRMNNWNPWINSNLMITNLILEKDAELRRKEVEKICRSIDVYLNEYWPDAGEEEGPGYFSVSPLCYFECADAIDSATGHASGVMKTPFIGAMARYIVNAHVAGEDYIDYGDAHPHATPDGFLVYRLGQAVHDDLLAGFGAACAATDGWTAEGKPLEAILKAELVSMSRAMPAVLGAAEVRAAKKNPGLVRDSYYPNLGLATARVKDGSAEGMYFAVLAANNGRSHSHNDTGSYILYLDGKPVTIDVGVEAYTAKTFSAERYTIWTMQSAYHNLPTIGGVMQHNGGKFKATALKHESNDERAVFSFDLAQAYPVEAGVKSWVRTVTLDRRRDTITVEEEFTLERAEAVTLNLMTQREAAVAAGLLTLKLTQGGGADCTLKFDAAKLDAKVETIKLSEEGGLKESWGEQVYRIQLNAKQPAASGKWSYEFARA